MDEALAESLSYGFRVALPPLGRAGPARYAGLLLIMKVQLLLILHCLFPHRHQVIIQLTWVERKQDIQGKIDAVKTDDSEFSKSCICKISILVLPILWSFSQHTSATAFSASLAQFIIGPCKDRGTSIK